MTITAMQPNKKHQLFAINLTYIARKKKIVRYIFSVSVHCELELKNKYAIETRLESMKILESYSDFVLTVEELKNCKYQLENCAECAYWEMLSERKKNSEQKCIIIYM
jgi:hypothetical protein